MAEIGESPYESFERAGRTRRKRPPIGPPTRALTKSEIASRIAEQTTLSPKQVVAVFDALASEIQAALSKKGATEFVVFGLLKIYIVQKAAVQARKGFNPFTKQEQMFKAMPPRRIVKVRPLKALRDLVQ